MRYSVPQGKEMKRRMFVKARAVSTFFATAPGLWLRGKEKGRAAAYEDLSVFSKKLKASTHFRDVVIRRASQRGDGIVDWSITCSAVYSA